VPIYTLEIEDNYDFDLIGISSHEKDYRLVWAMNKRMLWRMARIAEISMSQKDVTSLHGQFRFEHPIEQTVITLIDNKTQDGYFMQELQQFDYLLKIEGERKNCDDAFYKKLRSTPFVLTAFVLQIDKLKTKQNLLYEYR